MTEIEIPNGVECKLNGEEISFKGKFGSTVKRFNSKFCKVSVNGSKINVEHSKVSKKIEKVAALAETSLSSQINSAIKGVSNGIERKMQLVFAHFPITLEQKGKTVLIKNIFGERYPRSVKIYGDTKIEAKGQDVNVKGADVYDVNQSIANIRKACSSWGKDTRVFQDGLYAVKEE